MLKDSFLHDVKFFPKKHEVCCLPSSFLFITRKVVVRIDISGKSNSSPWATTALKSSINVWIDGDMLSPDIFLQQVSISFLLWNLVRPKKSQQFFKANFVVSQNHRSLELRAYVFMTLFLSRSFETTGFVFVKVICRMFDPCFLHAINGICWTATPPSSHLLIVTLSRGT